MSSNIRIQMVCEHCKKEFTAKTTVTRFCSDSCAKRAYKARKREEKVIKAKKVEFYKANNIDYKNLSDKPFLSIKEACILLGVSRMSLHRYIKKGLIPVKRLGGRVLISQEKLTNIFNE